MNTGITPRDLFGINAHIPDERTLRLIADAGMTWVRLDFNWWQLEPRHGEFNFDVVAPAVAAARALGLSIFATLGYAPEWAGGGPDHRNPPADPAAWAAFVRETVSRFKNDVKHWGMWNEPNGNYFNGTVPDYTNGILIPGARAAKEADPDCMIVAPDVVCFKGWRDWVRDIFASDEARQLVDVFACHIYKEKEKDGAAATIEMFEKGERMFREWPGLYMPGTAIRTVMANNGIGDLPLWLTETGWHTRPSQRDYAVSQEKQAAFYKAVCAAMLAENRSTWWQKTFFYEIKDDPGRPDKTQGIVDIAGNPKRAYTAYAEFLQSLPG